MTDSDPVHLTNGYYRLEYKSENGEWKQADRVEKLESRDGFLIFQTEDHSRVVLSEQTEWHIEPERWDR